MGRCPAQLRKVLPIYGEVSGAPELGPPHLWGGVRRSRTEGLTSQAQSFLLKKYAVNGPHHLVSMLVDIANRNPQDSKALCLKPGITALVICPPSVVIVRWTVDLDHEPGGRAIEVDEVGPDRMLAAEPPTINLPPAQAQPNSQLSPTHRLSEASRDQ